MDKQNDTSARGVEVGALLSTEETRKLWKEYQAGTLDKWMYGDLPLGWSQVVSKAQAVLTLKITGDWINRTLKIEDLSALKTRPSLLELVNGIQSLLRGEMPDKGSPPTPPPSEAIKP